MHANIVNPGWHPGTVLFLVALAYIAGIAIGIGMERMRRRGANR